MNELHEKLKEVITEEMYRDWEIDQAINQSINICMEEFASALINRLESEPLYCGDDRIMMTTKGMIGLKSAIYDCLNNYLQKGVIKGS